MMRAWILGGALLAIAGCDGVGRVTLASSAPPYGPVVGGTRITLGGSGFGAASNRVLIGGREAPLVATIDDATLEVVIPPGDRPGDAEVVVLNDRGNARAADLFHYSTPPTVTGAAPADILYTSITTPVTITGTGFADEGAGDVTVVVGGQLAADVVVTNDSSLTFTAPPGRPLLAPDIEVTNRRGRALERRGFRYVPSVHPGLLLFPSSGAFAVFLDPTDSSTVVIPWVATPSVRFSAVVLDERGDYWAVDRSSRFGRIDMTNQRLEAPIQVPGRYPTVVRVGGDYYALDRGSLRFGRFDRATGAFTAIGTTPLPCCGSYGLAYHDQMYLTAKEGTTVSINTIDPASGEIATPVPIIAAAGFHVEEMRFFDGKLYASSRDRTLVTIDPTTGVTTILPVPPGRFSAMEVFESTAAPE